jgi:hypothetical protein
MQNIESMGEMRNIQKTLIGKPMEDIIKMDKRETRV